MSQSPTTSTIHQFYTDAPRISFYFNATEFTKNTAVLHQRIIQFCNKHELDVEDVLLWCTQIPLAQPFVEKHNDISRTHSAHHHLLDNGRQRITFDDHTGAMHIVKPFRVDEENTHTVQLSTVKHLTLHVTVRQKEQPIVDWVEHAPPCAMPLVEKVGSLGVACALAVAYFVVHQQCSM